MTNIPKVDSGWGSFLKFKLLTETRPFELVEKALLESGIQDHHGSPLLERPKPATAFTRSMQYLSRVCAASIPFPKGSPNYDGDRNPNYSLKVESVKGMPHGEVAYRINISDRRLARQNMAHVLTATYKSNRPVDITPGDHGAWQKFGADIHKMVDDAFTKFFQNYDDNDIRNIVDKELAALKAVGILGKTTNFIAKDNPKTPHNTERAYKLVKFVKDCQHLANMLGLDAAVWTRDTIIDELQSSLMADLDECEEELDEKLNQKVKERKRGEKQRERMKGTADKNIDHILAQAQYHEDVLGVMAAGVRERAERLKAKALEFLTRDFGSGVPVPKAAQTAPSDPGDLLTRIATLEQENARLQAFQGTSVADPVEAQPAPVAAPAAPVEASPTAPVEAPAGDDPFAGVA